MYPSPAQRASDADREAVVAHLSAATTEGRLTLSEFSARTRHVYAARTWGELLRIVRDLPPMPPMPAPPKPATSAPPWPTIALTTGIVSVPLAFCAPVGLVVGLVAVVFGVLGLLPATRGAGQPRGMALAGLLCGTVGTALSVAMAIFLAGLDT